MASSEGESLFSFEVAVEYLRIDAATVSCRFPAVALRLLDFPTLLIPHIDKNEQDRFKAALLFDSYGEPPLKLKELLDARGNFQFNKGKSCMFKFVLSSLHQHLHNVPLYAMVTDMWGDVAKLVGVSTIPLSDIISSIRNDVQLKGLSYPSVHGHKDTFPVFNLMGSQVGVISLGYRLLSLGTSLIPHIPGAAMLPDGKNLQGKGDTGHVDLSLPREKSPELSYVDEEITGVVVQPVVPISGKQHDNSKNPLKPEAEGDDVPQQDANGSEEAKFNHKHKYQQTQTHNLQKTSGWRETRQNYRNEDFDIAMVINTHCPPPLIFNAQWESNVTRGPARSELYVHDDREFLAEDSVLTESSESIPSRSMEMQYRLQGGSPEKVRKIIRQSVGGLKVNHVSHQSPKIERLKYHKPGTSDEINDRGRLNGQTLPILTALLQELSILTGASSVQFHQTMEELLSDSKENIQPLQKAEPSDSKSKHTFLEPKPDVVHLPHQQRHQSCRHKLCAKSPKPVPSSKGWLRQEPVFKKRETKLNFKMTYSQKLRLKKNNPELLRRIEAEEDRQALSKDAEDRQSKPRMKQRTGKRAIQKYSSSGHPGVIPRETEIARYFREENVNHREPQMKSGSKSKVTSRGRHPVPTPRKSPAIDGQDVPHQLGILHYDKSGTVFETTVGTILDDATLGHDYDLTSSEKSSRSIEVFIPNPSLLESDAESGSERDEQSGEEANPQIPGFRAKSMESEINGSVSHLASSHSSYSQGSKIAPVSSGGYSDTFDDSKSSYHTPPVEEGEEEKSLETRSDVKLGEGGSGSTSPEFSSESRISVVGHAKKVVMATHETPVGDSTDKNEEEMPAEEVKMEHLLQGDEDAGRDDISDMKKIRHRDHTEPGASGLTLPMPLLSATSPVPQPRHPPSKILLNKPMTVNDEAYNQESVEVNLPSDLSASFDSTHPQREGAGSSLESLPGATRDGPCGDRPSLEVIISEPEVTDEDGERDSNAYSEDFASDFEDSDN